MGTFRAPVREDFFSKKTMKDNYRNFEALQIEFYRSGGASWINFWIIQSLVRPAGLHLRLAATVFVIGNCALSTTDADY